ncbi:MaoC family dehydratase [Brevibacillus daliensis]|uniref:MaoC family dehydratase n=1 Tax=Brevibacillus daliensis TaxID=2892995 RepID=UPI001E318F13|nr:MaoC family dehydratase [Brevibacillus daliensis]
MAIETRNQIHSPIQIGDKASFTKTITEFDVYSFAGIVGDFNPAHINEEYAKQTQFTKRIAHGMIGAGLLSTTLGTKLPGPGTIYLSQEVVFRKPIYFQDTITAEVEVIEMVDKGKFTIATMKTSCYNQNGELIIEGSAKVIPQKENYQR